MSNTGYGYALYYPYIHIQNDNWIKVAALYYDGLKRIVPEGFRTQDSAVVKSLNDEFQFIKDIRPRETAEAIAWDFLEYAQELSDPDKRKDMLMDIRKLLPPNSGFRIHEDKVAQRLRKELPAFGLAKKSDVEQPWYDFEPVTGALYMTFLANKVAEDLALPIVTDDPAYQSLIRGFQHPKYGWSRKDTGHALASIVIETAIPRNIESVSIQKISKFRRKHDSERHRFYEAIRELAKEIPSINNPDAFKACLNHHKKTIDEAIKDLNVSFKEVGISCITGLLGLSLPSWLSNLAQMEPGLGIQAAAGGLICMAAGVLLREGRNTYKSKRRSPWSYVLSLKRDLSSENFIKRLLRDTKIL